MNKFDGISIHMTSLRESFDRRQKTIDQFNKLGINRFEFFLTNRSNSINENLFVAARYPEYSWHLQGTVVTHLEMMRHWYITTNEPYAIFCEDDNDFTTSNYWNFTIQEFINNLPPDWECVQLLRYNLPPTSYGPECYDSKLKLFFGRYWGTCALMNRNYVKKCLDAHIKGLGVYDFRIIQQGTYPDPIDPNMIEYVENVLYLNKGIIYNFPLVTQLSPYDSDSLANSYPTDDKKQIWEINRSVFMNLWITQGKTLNLREALTISY